MNIEISRYKKIKALHEDWPKNAIMTSSALKRHGFSDQLIQRYCSSGWLVRIGSGGFIRHSEKPSIEGALYAIQSELKKPIHIGGVTALKIHGLAHYLESSPSTKTYLYNTTGGKHNLPTWFKSFDQEQSLHYIRYHLFSEEIGLKSQQMNSLDVLVSTPERAILEMLYLVPRMISIEHAYQLIENLQTIRPDLMQSLLNKCKHILVKRVFLCLAELARLPVMNHININMIELGAGERTIPPGGKYFPKYKLTIPYKEIDQFEEEFNV